MAWHTQKGSQLFMHIIMLQRKPLLIRSFSYKNSLESLIFFVPSSLSHNTLVGTKYWGQKREQNEEASSLRLHLGHNWILLSIIWIISHTISFVFFGINILATYIQGKFLTCMNLPLVFHLYQSIPILINVLFAPNTGLHGETWYCLITDHYRVAWCFMVQLFDQRTTNRILV